MEARTKTALQLTAGIVLLFALVTYKAGVEIAAWFVACGVIGYLNAFRVFRSLLSLIAKRKVAAPDFYLSALSVVSSIAIIWFGYGAVLALTTLSFILIDALVLRFK